MAYTLPFTTATPKPPLGSCMDAFFAHVFSFDAAPGVGGALGKAEGMSEAD